MKKVMILVTIILLTVSLTGCGKEPPAPTTPQASTSLNSQGHPTETPAQPSGKVSQVDVETKIYNLLNNKYPGDWKASGTTLSKESYTENGNYKIVDDVAALFPDTMGISIFVGEEWISSSVIQQTTSQRVLQG